MQPTRRRCLAIAGVGIGAGVAGCLSTGSNITYPEPESESEPETDPTEGSTNGSEEPAEPEPEPVENINTRLATETNAIYEELRWFETEHKQTIAAYQSRVREVVDALDSLLDSLDANGRITAQELEDVQTFADEVVIDVNGSLEPQFTDEFNFWAVNRNQFPIIERYRKREDWERVRTEIRDTKRTYQGATSSSALAQRYSSNPIDNRLYNERFRGSGGKMFEVRYISDKDNHHPDTVERQNPGFGVYVVNDATRDISFLQRPIDGAPLDVLSTMNEDYAPFEESTDRSYRLYVRIHSVGGGGSINPARTNSFPVYGQKYEDLRAADTAFQQVMSDKQVEDTVSWGSETWNRVLYTRNDERIYAYFIRAGSFLYAVGPSPTPWEEREEGWNSLLNGTWMNP